MSAEDQKIQHFLLVYDRGADRLVEERHLGTDALAAAEAYRAADQLYCDSPRMDVVLVGSDSIETVKKTHSTYFGGVTAQSIRELVAALGLGVGA